MRLSVIIPVYNRWDLTAKCLQSLREHTPGPDFEVIVADNASTDATATDLSGLGRQLFGPRFTALRHEQNLNFAGGCNSGAAVASGEFLFFLNNDTLLTPDWLAPLLDGFDEDSGLGAAGPLLLYENRRVQHLGIGLSFFHPEHIYAHFPAGHRVTRFARKDLQAITGAALMIPAGLFRSFGGFYQGYKNGFEDLELCRNVRRAGKKNACLPQSVILHLESQTAGRKDNESQNAALLTERCGADFKPDLHHLVVNDGFLAELSPLLDWHFFLSQEQEAYLTPLLREPGEEALAALLAEPFWAAGYNPVCAWLESRGRFAESLDLRFWQSSHYPGLASYAAWAKSATRAGRRDLAAYAGIFMQKAGEARTDARALRKKAQAYLRIARNHQDRALEKKLLAWMAERNLGAPTGT